MTTTVLLGVFFDSFVVCIQSTVWWTTWGHVCSFFIWRENWFSGIWLTKYRSTTFSVSVLVEPLAPPPNFTRFLPCLCGRACSVWHFQINSLVARAAQMGVRTGAIGKRPSSSWHILCRLLDTANLATLLTVAHTPLLSASRASKHHLSCMTPTNNPTPQPSPLLHFIDFHQGPIFLVPFPAAHLFWQIIWSSWWPLHLNYNHYKTLSATLRVSVKPPTQLPLSHRRSMPSPLCLQYLATSMDSFLPCRPKSKLFLNLFWMAHLEPSVKVGNFMVISVVDTTNWLHSLN